MKAEEIKILNIDGQPHVVEMMSDKIKRLVAMFNEWSQHEVDANDKLVQIQCAKQELSRQIINAVREEVAAAKAAEETPTGDAPQPPAE